MPLFLLTVLALTLVGRASASTRLSPRTRDPLVRARVHRVGVPVAAAVAASVTGYGILAAWTPRVTSHTVTSSGLPAAFDGMRIALVTDVHVGPVRGVGFAERVVERVNAARPALVVLVGDIVDGPERRFGPRLEPLRNLRAPLGVIAVAGNHEMYTGTTRAWLDRWRAEGVTVLENASTTLVKGRDRIVVAGVNDREGSGEFAADPAAALDGVAAEEFTIFLTHQARMVRQVQGMGVDLQLSGHTHGGQLWPFRWLVPLQQPVIDGLHTVGDVPVLTSRGAGTWGPPVRVGADPEIPVITLERS